MKITLRKTNQTCNNQCDNCKYKFCAFHSSKQNKILTIDKIKK